MSYRTACEHLLTNARVRAFLRVIRERESGQDDDAYRMRWPGLNKPVAFFDDFSDHPRVMEPTTGGRVSSAAGAYQITATTWDEIAPEIEARDFSPHEQDLAAVRLLAKRRIIDHLLDGNFDGAVAAARPTWTSLPGAEESSASWTMARARAVYDHWLAVYRSGEQPAAPIEDRTTPYQPPKEHAMPAPLIIPILSAIASFVPALAKVFNDGSVKGQRVEAVAPLLADAIVKVTGAVNLQDAAEKVQADPVAAQAAQKAVVDVVYELSEVGGGIEAARKHSAAFAAAPVSLWRHPAFVITLLLLPLVYIVVFMVLAAKGLALFVAPLFTTNLDLIDRIGIAFNFSADMQNVVITAIIAGVLSGVTGYFLGTSFGSQNRRASDNNQ